jgi:ribonucleoside-diphosphate reductase alpha chain
MTQIQVTKRHGNKEPLDLEKLHRVVFWATKDITGVSASEVEIKSHIQFYNGIKTSAIQETLIKSAADLISEETPNYQFVAGRLINYHLRKEVYGDYDPWPLLKIVQRNVENEFYVC